MFSTVGNVATLPAARGRGYMTMLLDKAMQGLEEIGADASRLFGNRVRYGRYGYLPCGTIHNFTVTPQKGVCRHRFVPIEGASDSVLQDCMTLQKSAPFYVKRETPDVFYDTLIAWEDSPYAVYDENDHFCGYISVTKDRSAIYEIACTSTEDFKSVLESYRAKATAPFSVDIPPYLMKEIAYLSGFAACQIKNPSLFFVRHWDKVADALLRLKASYTALPDFRTVIGIEGQCNLEIAVEHGKTFCQKTNAAADKIMNALDASEYLFGTDRLPDAQNDIFPLPMTWITLDRV